MQYPVPQFIDVEDKIFGPFSFKQFLYLLGGGGGAFVIWKLLPWYLAIPLIIPVVSLAGALTFMKVNNRPFAFALQAWIGYIFTNKLYLWQQRKPEIKKQEEKKLHVNEIMEIARHDCLVWAIGNQEILDKFKADTKIDLLKTRSPIEAMVDKACEFDYEEAMKDKMAKFVAWFDENIWENQMEDIVYDTTIEPLLNKQT